MSNVSEKLDKLAEAIRHLDPYANPIVRITEPKVGLSVGICINCGCQAKLDFMLCKNTWNPPEFSNQVLLDICTDGLPDNIEPDGDFFIIFQIEPYIDAIYVHFTREDNVASMYKKRFVFREDYKWDYEDERLLVDHILNDNRLGFTCVIDEIFNYYSENIMSGYRIPGLMNELV